MKKCPCHNCSKRKVTSDYNCHSHCSDFDEYVEDRAKYHTYNNGNNSDYMNYRKTMILKRKKKKNEKNHT